MQLNDKIDIFFDSEIIDWREFPGAKTYIVARGTGILVNRKVEVSRRGVLLPQGKDVVLMPLHRQLLKSDLPDLEVCEVHFKKDYALLCSLHALIGL